MYNSITSCVIGLFFGFLTQYFSLMNATSIEICDKLNSEYVLKSNGVDSEISVVFLSNLNEIGPCKVRISTEETHIVSVSFFISETQNANFIYENSSLKTLNVDSSENNISDSSCILTIYLPESNRTPVWKVDLCQEPLRLPPSRLLTHQLKVIWNPPRDGRIPEILSRTQLVFTAVGRGDDCYKPGQHACWKVGWSPLMCISEDLLCNGIPNCPRDESDESPELCAGKIFGRSPKQNSKSDSSPAAPGTIEYLAKELFLKLANHHSNRASLTDLEENLWLQRPLIGQNKKSTTSSSILITESPKKSNNMSFMDALKAYGSWGYLILALLISGSILMFCGFWECFCRGAKEITSDTIDRHNQFIDPRLLQNGGIQSAFLIINQSTATSANDLATNQEPPSYDDLDQPPSYSLLFPNNKIAESFMLNNTPQGTQNNSETSRNNSSNQLLPVTNLVENADRQTIENQDNLTNVRQNSESKSDTLVPNHEVIDIN